MHAVCTRRSPQCSRTRAILQRWLRRDGPRGWPSSTATTCAQPTDSHLRRTPTYLRCTPTYGVFPLKADSHLRRTLAWLIPTYGVLPRSYGVLPRSYGVLPLAVGVFPLAVVRGDRGAAQGRAGEARRAARKGVSQPKPKSSYRWFRVFVPLLRNTRTVVSEYSCACYEILVPLFSRCA